MARCACAAWQLQGGVLPDGQAAPVACLRGTTCCCIEAALHAAAGNAEAAPSLLGADFEVAPGHHPKRGKQEAAAGKRGPKCTHTVCTCGSFFRAQ